jgi:hypothetical protein
MQPARRVKLAHDGSQLPSVPLSSMATPNQFDIQDGVFDQIRQRNGENTPLRDNQGPYRGVNRETVEQGDQLHTLAARSTRLAKDNMPTSAEFASAPLPVEALVAIHNHNARHMGETRHMEREQNVLSAPEFHSKLDRESFPVVLFDIIESMVCVPQSTPDIWKRDLAELLSHESFVFLTEPAAHTARRQAYVNFERNSTSRRNLSAPMHEWRSRWIGPHGGGQTIVAQDYILFDAEDVAKEPPRPLPNLPPRLERMYAEGLLVCDIYRVDESFYAMCFYKPCVKTPGHHQYLGCFYTQSEQSADRDLSESPQQQQERSAGVR